MTHTVPFELTPPSPVAPVDTEQAAGMVRLNAAKCAELDEKVQHFVDAILQEPLQNEAFKSRVSGVHALANEDIRAAALLSNRLLEQPARALDSGLFDDGSTLSRSLVDLRRTIESLDPSRRGDLLSPRKLLGFIPWGNSIQDYFREYQSAQTHLDQIIKSLYSGQDELRKDNAAIEEEKAHAWGIMERLEEYVYLGKKIDAAISGQLLDLETSDPEKARIVKEELLFYIRQKVQDLLTQLAVTIQGYLAMDMIRKNNLELIKGVDRATTTTVSALRTAVIVAQALANQKLVLDQVSALNTTTSQLIETTARLMKGQASTIQEQSANATVDLDKLKLAFQTIYDTMNLVSNYKMQALDNMQKTVDVLSVEVSKSKNHLDALRDEPVQAMTRQLKIAPDELNP